MPKGVNNNLIPANERTKEELSAMGRKGQPRAAKKRVENRTFREAITAGLRSVMPGGVLDEGTSAMVDAIIKSGKCASVQDAIIAALFRVAVSGEPRSVEAAKLILAQIGEDTAEKQEIVVKVDSSAGDIMG